MLMPSFVDLDNYMQFANAAYLVTEEGFKWFAEKMGATFLGVVQNNECQVVFFRWKGKTIKCTRGTQVTEHTSIPEILDDLKGGPLLIPNYGYV